MSRQKTIKLCSELVHTGNLKLNVSFPSKKAKALLTCFSAVRTTSLRPFGSFCRRNLCSQRNDILDFNLFNNKLYYRFVNHRQHLC